MCAVCAVRAGHAGRAAGDGDEEQLGAWQDCTVRWALAGLMQQYAFRGCGQQVRGGGAGVGFYAGFC